MEVSLNVTSPVEGFGGPPKLLGLQIRRITKAIHIKNMRPIITQNNIKRDSGEMLQKPNDKEIKNIPKKLSTIIAAPKISRTPSTRTFTEATIPLVTL